MATGGQDQQNAAVHVVPRNDPLRARSAGRNVMSRGCCQQQQPEQGCTRQIITARCAYDAKTAPLILALNSRPPLMNPGIARPMRDDTSTESTMRETPESRRVLPECPVSNA